MTVGGRIGQMWLVVLFGIAYEMLRVGRGSYLHFVEGFRVPRPSVRQSGGALEWKIQTKAKRRQVG